MDNITNPHDKLFREIWSHRDSARDFLQNYLPPPVLQTLNLDSLVISKDSFIDRDLKQYFSDLLYTVKFGETTGYVYILFEHKSYPETWIHLQLLEYMLKIWRLHIKQSAQRASREKPQLPIILPLVLFHGKTRWTPATPFIEILSGPCESLQDYIPNFRYELIDLTANSDEEIKGEVLSRVALLLFKHIFAPDFAKHLPGIIALMRDIFEQEHGLQTLETFLRYITSTAENITQDEIQTMLEKALSEKGGEALMTLAEQWIHEGIEQGKLEGLSEAIELGISLRFGDEYVEELMPFVHALHDPEQLETIKNAIKRVKEISELKALIKNSN